MNIIAVSLILSLFLISFVNASVYNLCLTNGQTVKFSLCNPNIVDRYCSKSVCQYCVSENNGVYCPMSLNSCNDPDCHYLPNVTSSVVITITPLNPANSYSTSATSLTFSYKVSNYASVNSCSLYVNDIFLASNSSKIGSATNYIDVDLEPGNYDWYIKCMSKSGNATESSARTLNIASDNPVNQTNQTEIIVSLLNPANNTPALPGIVIFNYSVSNISSINQCNLIVNGNTLSSANSSMIIAGSNNFSLNMTNGSYNWNIGCIDKSLRTIHSETRFLNVTNDIAVTPVITPTEGGGGGGSSSGGGGGALCGNKWICEEWSECTDRIQTRTCDYNRTKCKPEASKPIESQSCAVQVSNSTTNSTNETINPVSTKSTIENLITGASVALNNPRTLWASIIVIVICIVIGYFLIRKGKKPEEAVVEEKPVKKPKKEK